MTTTNQIPRRRIIAALANLRSTGRDGREVTPTSTPAIAGSLNSCGDVDFP